MVQRAARLLLLVLAVAASACAAKAGVPRPFPGAALPPGAAVPPGGDGATPVAPPPGTAVAPGRDVVAMALGYRGVPYRFGGSDPAGFDCSGFVQYVFKQTGTLLPREVRDQFTVGDQIERRDVQPGDLVFFETVARGASHVGVAIGNGEFVHAPSSRGVVRVERLEAGYWAQRYVGARRLR